MWYNPLHISMRVIKMKPFYSLINILSLTASISFACLLSLWILHDTSTDHFHPNAKNIYLVGSKYEYSSKTVKSDCTPDPLAKALMDENPEIEKTTRFSKIPMPMSIKYGDHVFIESTCVSLTNSFFQIFDFPLLKGDPAKILLRPDELVMSETTARKYFGSEDPIGKTLVLMGQIPMTVCGIFKDLPDNTQFEFDIAFSFEIMKIVNPYAGLWGSSGSNTWVMLKPNTNSALLSEKVKNTIKNHVSALNQEIQLIPFLDFYYDNTYETIHTKKGNFQYIKLFIAVVFFILVIAAVNFVNLNTALAGQRFKEIGLKKVLGSERWRIALQFIFESFSITSIAMILSWGFTLLLLPFIEKLSGVSLSLGHFYPYLLLFTFLTAFILGIIGGFYPAFLMARKSVIDTFNDPSKNITGRFSLEKILVVVQFSIALFLITGTLLIKKQMQFMKDKELGFDKAQLALIETNPELSVKYSLFKENMKGNSIIEDVSCIDLFPSYMDNWTSSIHWEGKEEGNDVSIAGSWVDPEFFKTMGIPLKAGRDFLPGSEADHKNAFIINKKAQELMNLENPVGKSFSYLGRNGVIVGVVEDACFHSLHSPVSPRVFIPVDSPNEYMQTNAGGTAIIRIAPGKTKEAAKLIQKWFDKNQIQTPLDLHFLDQKYMAMYSKEARMGHIFSVFSMLSIFISCMGVFILNSFYTQKKSKEIAVRRINGANISTIFSNIINYQLRWVSVAVLITVVPTYYILNKWLENFAYKTSLSWWIFTLAGLLALGIALLTVSWQSWKAATRNPVEALRYE